MGQRLGVGIDIGGTGIKVAAVDLDEGRLASERRRVLTPQPATPKAVARVIGEMLQHDDIRGPAIVGAGFPAVVKSGTILTAANVAQNWIGTDAGSLLSAVAGRTVYMLNDADAAGLAEVRFGAGRGQMGEVIMVTLGTGIGTGMFVDGKLVPNSELGHIEVRCKDAELRAAASVRVRKKLSWKTWAANVEEYLNALDRLIWPDLIIIGGGVSAEPEKFLPLIKTRCRVVPAKLGNDAGIIGAALYAAETAAALAQR